jgi:transposase
MGEARKRRKYDKEFKEGAVRLVLDGDRSVREVAKDLGIHENMLHKWRQQYMEDKEQAFPGKGHMKPQEEELWTLKRRITDLEEERAILKKALAIFSKHPK